MPDESLPSGTKITANDPETQSANLVGENLERLKALFPDAFREGKVDFDVLRQLLGGAVDEREEKYGLNWHGKRQARQIALTPSVGTLRPCPEESVDWDTTQNLMIEGDNLEVLKLLQKSYAGKVKLIYIDPPYNTGKDFVYPDDYRDSIKNYLELTGQGRRFASNPETSGRYHTDWLNMMYPRLKMARGLLDDDGAIFCSIDDVEAARLRVLLDEVFGEDNFLAQFSWKTEGNYDNQAKVKVCHEYVVLYAKVASSFPHPPVVDPSTPADSKVFNPEIRNTIVKNGHKNPISTVRLPCGFPSEIGSGRIATRTAPWPMYHSDALIEDGRLVNAVTVESGWSSKDLLLEFIANDFKPIRDGKNQETLFVISRSGAIEAVKRRSDYQSHVISVLSGFDGTQRATAQLVEMGAFFDGYPKPVSLIRYLVSMAYDKSALVLDFFAGSGPVAQAVLEQNVLDLGGRRYILVQIPESLDPLADSQRKAASYCDKIGKPRTVAELTKERLRRAGAKVRKENPLFKGDTGFRVFKLDSSNIRAWDPNRDKLKEALHEQVEHLLPGRSEQDVLFELLLKLGLDLTVPIVSRTIAGKTVHSIGAGALMVSLADGLTGDSIEDFAQGILTWRKEIAPPVSTSFVFKDSGFVDDVAKLNLVETLKQGLASEQISGIRSV